MCLEGPHRGAGELWNYLRRLQGKAERSAKHLLHDDLIGEDPRWGVGADVPVRAGLSAGGAYADMTGGPRGELDAEGFGEYRSLVLVGAGLYRSDLLPGDTIGRQLHFELEG